MAMMNSCLMWPFNAKWRCCEKEKHLAWCSNLLKQMLSIIVVNLGIIVLYNGWAIIIAKKKNGQARTTNCSFPTKKNKELYSFLFWTNMLEGTYKTYVCCAQPFYWNSANIAWTVAGLASDLLFSPVTCVWLNSNNEGSANSNRSGTC